jgi:hypothetical protein
LIIRGRGVFGASLVLSLLVAVLIIPRFFSDPFTPAEASDAVRHFLKWQIYQRGTAQLKYRNMATADLETAKRWQQEIDRVTNLEIVSVETKRTIFHLASFHPSYIIKAVLRDPNGERHTRYFSTKYEMILAERSEFSWWLGL